ncbi:MAG: LamG domain-containing protein, partial [Candidatus Poribacteria bacterium]
AATFSGEVLALYVNGVLAGEKDIGGANPSIVMNDNENSIGGRDTNASWFVGVIDEFALFSRALEEQEIRRWMDQAFAVDPEGRLATMWSRVKAQ